MMDLLTLMIAGVLTPSDTDLWVSYPGAGDDAPHVVLIAGDEEYRSEEALPQLGKILSVHHGVRCTVLFPIDPQSGEIVPTCLDNIPGLEALETADLMVIATRFRDLPDEQMQHIDAYLKAGKPVLGLRTATHGFRNAKDGPWAHYANGYNGPRSEWKGGFGRLVLGEKWVAHHGAHGSQSSRGILAPDQAKHPALRGLSDGDVWGPSDVYRVRMPMLEGTEVVMLGQVLDRAGPGEDGDPLMGMRPDDRVAEGARNDPLMPLAWFRPTSSPAASRARPSPRRSGPRRISWRQDLGGCSSTRRCICSAARSQRAGRRWRSWGPTSPRVLPSVDTGRAFARRTTPSRAAEGPRARAEPGEDSGGRGLGQQRTQAAEDSGSWKPGRQRTQTPGNPGGREVVRPGNGVLARPCRVSDPTMSGHR